MICFRWPIPDVSSGHVETLLRYHLVCHCGVLPQVPFERLLLGRFRRPRPPPPRPPDAPSPVVVTLSIRPSPLLGPSIFGCGLIALRMCFWPQRRLPYFYQYGVHLVVLLVTG